MFAKKRQTARIISSPAPIGGWNVRDPLPDMKPLDAVVLDNMFCLPSELMIRKGYTEWATGLTGDVETIFDYDAPDGTEHIFAATTAGNIYDVTSMGAVGAPVVTGLGSSRFKHCHFTNSGGTFLHVVNGVDYLMIYDGTSIYEVTDISTPYAITGVDTRDLIDVTQHKRRLWFVEKNSMNGWYLATDAIAGTATKFDFGPIFSRGGHIVKIDTWTLDAGYGVDDYFMVFTSAGEVAVYRGTDPASAVSWALTGIFYIGTPTRNSGSAAYTCKYGGDLLIINKDGIAQMSKALMSSRVNTQLQMTDKIQPQLASDTTLYANNYGWDLLLYPPQNMLLVNIPTSSSTAVQYVMNTISGAWARWTDIPAKCWYFASETLFFGTSGKVMKMWDGQNDNGANITAHILPAFQRFGSDSQLKRWNMSRVIYGYNAQINVGSTLAVDFDRNIQSIPLPVLGSIAPAIWGVSKWGDGSVWGGQIYTDRKWKSVSGMGYWGSLQINIESRYSDVRLFSIDYSIEGGGVF